MAGRNQQNTRCRLRTHCNSLDYVQSNLRSDYEVCVQNIWTADGPGEYTGELVASMVKDFGVNWTLVGHSERRYKVAAETNELLLAKTKAALDAGLKAIFCIGEVLEGAEGGRDPKCLHGSFESSG